MSRTVNALVLEDNDGERLDAYLATLTSISSRSAAVRLLEDGAVLVNGEIVTVKKHTVSQGDRVSVSLPEADQAVLVPQFIPLDIRFEDDRLIVLSKQEDLVCHPSTGHPSGTLANALVAHCGIDNLGTLQGEDRPGIVHRLDKDTTGLMVAAKDDGIQAALQALIGSRELDRRYLALVHGSIAPDTGLIDAPIARHERDRYRMTVSDSLSARDALTTFSVVERFESFARKYDYTLLECKLYTGRTHQIRVHMAYIDHPCVGDPLYGRISRDGLPELGLERQFLHSYRIGFTHPATGEVLEFTDPLPDDLARVLEDLQRYSAGRTEYGESVMEAISAT